MGKNKTIEQLTNLLSRALRHKIGSIANKENFYATRYAKDAEVLLREAEKVLAQYTWNMDDKKEIEAQLRKKLIKELTEKDFLDNKKFEIMDDEMENMLKRFKLSSQLPS